MFNIALKLLRRGLFSHNRSQLVEEVCWAQVAFVENMHTPHPLVHGLWNLLIEGALDFEHQVLRQELFKTFPAPVDALRPGKSTYKPDALLESKCSTRKPTEGSTTCPGELAEVTPEPSMASDPVGFHSTSRIGQHAPQRPRVLMHVIIPPPPLLPRRAASQTNTEARFANGSSGPRRSTGREPTTRRRRPRPLPATATAPAPAPPLPLPLPTTTTSNVESTDSTRHCCET